MGRGRVEPGDRGYSVQVARPVKTVNAPQGEKTVGVTSHRYRLRRLLGIHLPKVPDPRGDLLWHGPVP